LNIKGQISPDAIIVGDFSSPLLIDRSSRQKQQQKMSELNHTIEQMDLTNIYRIIHPTDAEYYSFFSAVPRISSKIGHIFIMKEGLNNKKIDSVSCV
jgi:hypothetical protein